MPSEREHPFTSKIQARKKDHSSLRPPGEWHDWRGVREHTQSVPSEIRIQNTEEVRIRQARERAQKGEQASGRKSFGKERKVKIQEQKKGINKRLGTPEERRALREEALDNPPPDWI
jgi:hypothetical protein